MYKNRCIETHKHSERKGQRDTADTKNRRDRRGLKAKKTKKNLIFWIIFQSFHTALKAS